LITAAIAMATAWQAVEAVRTARQLLDKKALEAALAAQADRSRHREGVPPQAASAAAKLEAHVGHLMSVADFDVAAVLRSIESVRLPGARLLELEIDAESRRVDMQLEASNADTVARYVQALNAAESGPGWTLVRLQLQGATQSVLIRAKLP
jgi:hypothetical protein